MSQGTGGQAVVGSTDLTPKGTAGEAADALPLLKPAEHIRQAALTARSGLEMSRAPSISTTLAMKLD